MGCAKEFRHLNKMSDDYVRDAMGWIDDFRALPGECGHPLTRAIYAHSLLQQGTSLKQLRQMGFTKELIKEVSDMLINDAYPD